MPLTMPSSTPLSNPSLPLTLIRGLPGSGKSTLAKKIVKEAQYTTQHLEADMFFVNDSGRYLFQPALLKQAHDWCQQQCQHFLKLQHNVVVANTFVEQWEMKAYRQLAKQYNATLQIKVCTGKFNSIHDVPAETIKKMQKRWQA
ncbi:ATP-binding protein [Psychromonas sp. SA13A]|uniref:ATP-binding protein n=1 Tax=Psychromonas sp. SA13A TaxID=2686346 RepID=UPI001F0D7D2A|nr:ATP-binding protein [Psychromonas sp. SA13A]